MLVSTVYHRVNNSVFKRDLKTAKFDDDVTLDGRVFHTGAAANWKCATTDGCTTDSRDVQFRCRRRAQPLSTSATRWNSQARYDGARPLRHLKTSTASLKSISSEENAAIVTRVEAASRDRTCATWRSNERQRRGLTAVHNPSGLVRARRRVTAWLVLRQNVVYCEDDVEQEATRERLRNMCPHWNTSVDVYIPRLRTNADGSASSVHAIRIPESGIWCYLRSPVFAEFN